MVGRRTWAAVALLRREHACVAGRAGAAYPGDLATRPTVLQAVINIARCNTPETGAGHLAGRRLAHQAAGATPQPGTVSYGA